MTVWKALADRMEIQMLDQIAAERFAYSCERDMEQLAEEQPLVFEQIMERLNEKLRKREAA